MSLTLALLLILVVVAMIFLLNSGNRGALLGRGSTTRVVEREVVKPEPRVVEREVAEPSERRVVEREVVDRDDPNAL